MLTLSRAAVQVAFRWAGDANISMAIELPAGGEHTRMVPKVTDIQVAGVARVSLTPLVPEIPGFGAAVISLRRAPLLARRPVRNGEDAYALPAPVLCLPVPATGAGLVSFWRAKRVTALCRTLCIHSELEHGASPRCASGKRVTCPMPCALTPYFNPYFDNQPLHGAGSRR